MISTTYVEEVIKAIVDRMQYSQEHQRFLEQQVAKRPYTCGIYGGNHSNFQCAPKNPKPLHGRPVIQVPQWCNFHQKWGNQNTKNCVEQVKHAQAQAIKVAPYVEPKVAPMIGYCLESGISHLMPDCPYKPTPKPKESLKIVEVSSTSSGLDTSQHMVPINVVTREQKLKDVEVQTVNEEKPAESSKNSWKA